MSTEYLPAEYVAARRQRRIAQLRASIAYLSPWSYEVRWRRNQTREQAWFATQVSGRLAAALVELDELLTQEFDELLTRESS